MSLLKGPKDKALEREWYQRLKDEGFQDIEDTSDDHRDLKRWHSYDFLRRSRHEAEAISIYYSEADDILHNHRFEDPDHEAIWLLHCQGVSEREIAKQVSRYKKSMIHVIIDQISKMIKD